MTTKRIVLGAVMVDETGKQASDLEPRSSIQWKPEFPSVRHPKSGALFSPRARKHRVQCKHPAPNDLPVQ